MAMIKIAIILCCVVANAISCHAQQDVCSYIKTKRVCVSRLHVGKIGMYLPFRNKIKIKVSTANCKNELPNKYHNYDIKIKDTEGKLISSRYRAVSHGFHANRKRYNNRKRCNKRELQIRQSKKVVVIYYFIKHRYQDEYTKSITATYLNRGEYLIEISVYESKLHGSMEFLVPLKVW